jgi:uncharacterized membrane protein YhiD involved in acid resistance
MLLVALAGIVFAAVILLVGWATANLAALTFALSTIVLLLASRSIGQWPERYQADNCEALAELADQQEQVTKQQTRIEMLLQELEDTEAP